MYGVGNMRAGQQPGLQAERQGQQHATVVVDLTP